ncbi:unnamed protein product [Cladocopium goreaui]|uniref:DUF2087 domain-containing protein n=1 Tax=Cladocopium goreaui TaxID=2562237 RepID=A0A9P1CSC6_9DINO|nr:unnamed protein product [Cladocopium goreaui]
MLHIHGQIGLPAPWQVVLEPQKSIRDSTKEMVSTFDAMDDFEKELQEITQSVGASEEDLKGAKVLPVNPQMREEQQIRQVAKLKALMMREQQTKRRVNKIKSKTYRRIHRKAELRDREAMLQRLEVENPELARPKERLRTCSTEKWILEDVLDRDLEYFQVVHDYLTAPAALCLCPPGCFECLVDHADTEVTLKCADGSTYKHHTSSGILQGPPGGRVVELLCTDPCPVKQARHVIDGSEGQELKWRSVADGEQQILFLEDAVPVHDFRLGDHWLESDKERLFWQETKFYQIFPLEMSMWSAILQKLLKVYFVGGIAETPRFRSWPGRDRHQLWASLWLALRFQVQHSYSLVELQWVVAYHLDEPTLPLIKAVQSELFRRGFLEECPDDVQFSRLSISGVKWVLDGDKFFRSRKADAAGGKAWWQLPLNTQHVLLSSGPIVGDNTPLLPSCGPVGGFSAYRVIFLAMNLTDEELKNYCDKVSCQFRHRDGPVATTCSWGVLTEAAQAVPFVSHMLLNDAICLECDVASETTLPPLRIDGSHDANAADGWQVLVCQAMPTTEASSPPAFPSPQAKPLKLSPRSREFERAREVLEAQLCNFIAQQRLKQWPSKGKVQRLAALWLILHFEPGRCYTELEVDWIIATGHNLAAKVPDCARIRKDLERTGFICREAGGGSFHLRPEMVEQLLASLDGKG